ncbi:MAG: WHG domain-containing protein [Actinomycetota bacterium]
MVAEAMRVADEVGLDKLTLAEVAARLGVRLPSLYKHVAGLDALRGHVAVAAGRELGAALVAASVGRAGIDALLALSDAYRAFAHRRPGAYAATVRAPDPLDTPAVAVATAVLKVVFDVLAGFGLTGDDAIDATRGWRALLHGFVAIEAAGGYRMPQDLDRSFHRLISAFGDSLRGWAVTAATPV